MVEVSRITRAEAQRGDLRGLLTDERFLRADFEQKVLALTTSGLDDATAKQVATMVQRKQPQGPSVMDVPPDERSVGTRLLGTAGSMLTRSAPAIAGEVAGEVAGPFMGIPSQVAGAGGAMIGETASMVAGLNPFSFEQILLAGSSAAAAPPTGQLARRGLSIPAKAGQLNIPFQRRVRLAARTPGGAGAVQEIAREQVEKIPARIRARTDELLAATRPGETVSSLFEAALQRQASQAQRSMKNALVSGEGTDLVTLFHGTTPTGSEAIRAIDKIEGPSFFASTRATAEEFGEEVLSVQLPKNQLKLDFDLPGGKLLDVDEANDFTGNSRWTIDDYINKGVSVGVERDVFLSSQGLPSREALVPLRETFRQSERVREIQRKAGIGGAGNKRLKNVSADLSKLSRQTAGVPLDILDIQRREIEGLLGATQNKALKRQYRIILSGIFKDIDNAATAGVQGATDLKDAIMFSRRNLAADDFQNLLDKPGVISKPQLSTGAQEIRVNTLLDGVTRARQGKRPPVEFRLLKDSVPDDELLDIEKTLAMWNEAISALPPPRGVQFGSGPNLLVGAGAGAVARAATGSTEVGIAAGATALGAKFILSRILMSPTGRRVLRETIEQGQPIDLVQIASSIVLQTSRQALGENPSQMLIGAQGGEQLSAPR